MNNSPTLGNLVFTDLGINLDEVPIETFFYYQAVEYFFNVEDEPPPTVSNLDKVRRYMQSFEHLCEVEDWERAKTILFVRLNTPTQQTLDNQLLTWGYHRERIDLYSRVLNKLSPILDTSLLLGLGGSYKIVG
ncbi:MAG: hypothetical protein KME30_06090 [Iphinoe sp. HA4291-MV1]|jgi:hypothetical protein|nr:hypothetical protein [Iphinoe sp. HA4291-MV1]